ncbi:hypothetical protein [Dickeya lacustris]|uniref:Uncharacterized protein n=1 Tax=Dickeya lacustris TaxID=2259638 RepID=A0ABY8GA10_9GAMM|nr:hypothetical protein [Dickeya lacustris]WFN56821.1 hypothetical protein O1Q98_06070 [Dickeya lacustris]
MLALPVFRAPTARAFAPVGLLPPAFFRRRHVNVAISTVEVCR